jgi:hypothetical protein
MSFAELYDPKASAYGGRVFLLEIAGPGTGDAPVRYYCGPPPPAKTDAGSGKVFVDIEAIIPETLSPISGHGEPGGGVSSYSPIVIEIARQERAGPYDPGVVLDRNSYRHETTPGVGQAYARLARTLEADDTPGQVVYLDRNPSVLGALPGHIAVGLESMWATAAAGDGSVGNPWRLTGVTRGIRGTTPITHYVGTRDSSKGFVKREVISWENRRAILYAAFRRLDGSVGDYAEAMRGFLSGAPVSQVDRMAVALVPMVAAIERHIGPDGRRVGLHRTRHCIEGSAATRLQHAQSWKPERAFKAITGIATAAAGSPIECSTVEHARVFDVGLAAATPGHPRIGRLRLSAMAAAAGGSWDIEPDGYAVGPPGFTVAAVESLGTTAATIVTNPQISELVSVDFISPAEAGNRAVKGWPDEYLDTINLSGGWVRGQRDGLTGSWVDVAVVKDAELGAQLRVTWNPTSGGDPIEPAGPIALRFWAGFGTSEWPSTWGPYPEDWSSGSPVGIVPYPVQFYYPIRMNEPGDDRDFYVQIQPDAGGMNREVEVDTDPRSYHHYIPISICEGGWYQAGEESVTADGEVLTNSAGDAWIRIESTGIDGERRVQRARVVAVDEVEAGVWRLMLDRRSRVMLRSFGDWAGNEPTIIAPDAHMSPRHPGEQMLHLLMSAGGRGVAGNGYDSLPFGAGLLVEDIDISSFLRVAAPPDMEAWAPVVPPDGITLSELFAPMLEAMGVAMVMKPDTLGRVRIALEDVGPTSSVMAVAGTLTDAMWHLSGPPEGAVDGRVTNRRSYLTDHADGGEGDATVKANLTDNASVAAHGASQSKAIELRGINLRDGGVPDILGPLLVIDARQAALTGYARAEWKGTTTTNAGSLLYVGAVVRVTSTRLKGFRDTPGVTSVLARVRRIRTHLAHDGCDLVLNYHGNKSTGWNLALRVVAVPALDQVEVDVPGTWAPLEHPVTGQAFDPLTVLEVTHQVDAVPWGAHDDRVPGGFAVTAINSGTRVITLDGNHGLAGPNFGRIVWTVYMAAPEIAKDYGYLADDNDLLGGAAAGDELV